jgi:hypothetical protein
LWVTSSRMQSRSTRKNACIQFLKISPLHTRDYCAVSRAAGYAVRLPPSSPPAQHATVTTINRGDIKHPQWEHVRTPGWPGGPTFTQSGVNTRCCAPSPKSGPRSWHPVDDRARVSEPRRPPVDVRLPGVLGEPRPGHPPAARFGQGPRPVKEPRRRPFTGSVVASGLPAGGRRYPRWSNPMCRLIKIRRREEQLGDRGLYCVGGIRRVSAVLPRSDGVRAR